MVLLEGEDWDDNLHEFLFFGILIFIFCNFMFLIYNMFDCHICGLCATTMDVPST